MLNPHRAAFYFSPFSFIAHHSQARISLAMYFVNGDAVRWPNTRVGGTLSFNACCDCRRDAMDMTDSMPSSDRTPLRAASSIRGS